MEKESNGVLPQENFTSTFIPICKYSPEFLDKIIKYKLHNLTRINIVNDVPKLEKE